MRQVSYERFGVHFLRAAVTPDRIRNAVSEVAGDVIEMGPLSAGPANAATVKARGEVAGIDVQQIPGRLLRFTATITVSLDLDVRVVRTRHRYQGEILIPLHLTVHTAKPLLILIDIADVDPRDVAVDLRATGTAARWLQRIGGVDEEVRSRVAAIVGRRLESDAARAVRRIDISTLIDSAWPS